MSDCVISPSIPLTIKMSPACADVSAKSMVILISLENSLADTKPSLLTSESTEIPGKLGAVVSKFLIIEEELCSKPFVNTCAVTVTLPSSKFDNLANVISMTKEPSSLICTFSKITLWPLASVMMRESSLPASVLRAKPATLMRPFSI